MSKKDFNLLWPSFRMALFVAVVALSLIVPGSATAT
jgi:hypothetical protein